jgi:hypothetical protein
MYRCAVKLMKTSGEKNFSPHFTAHVDGKVILAKKPIDFYCSFMLQSEQQLHLMM